MQVASKGSYSTLHRPLRLYPLEITDSTHKEDTGEDTHDAQEKTVEDTQEEADSSVQPVPVQRRECPVRAAARRANENRRLLIEELEKDL